MFLICCNKKIELNSVIWEYMYPYFLRFSIKHNIDWTVWNTKNIVFIPIEKKEELIFMLENIFEELMKECYNKPTQRQITKHSSRFEKIIFKEKIYILNYATDIVGIIGYRLNHIIEEFTKN